jgi:hypothetical protein
MEEQGYKAGDKDNQVLFYRHGTEQGRVGEKQIDEQMARRVKDTKRIGQIKAFIHKYKQTHDPTIAQNKNPNIHASVKASYQSELTNHLQKTFGVQFIFHGERHKHPYGYTIIDHAHKSVFKGSEVMKLEELGKPIAKDQKQEQKQKEQKVEKPEKSETDITRKITPAISGNNRHSEDTGTRQVNKPDEVHITTGLSNVIGNTDYR